MQTKAFSRQKPPQVSCCPCKVAEMLGSTAGVVSLFIYYECHSNSRTQCCFDLEVV